MRSEQPPAAYAVGGAPVGALVRVVVGIGDLQVDTDGSANGARWTTIAHLDGVLPGYFLNVLLDSALPAGTYVGALPAPVPAAPSFALAAFGTSLDAGGWDVADQFPRALADVNGDGLSDMVAFGYAGANVARRRGRALCGAVFFARRIRCGEFGRRLEQRRSVPARCCRRER